jgi:pimeloyl-ACP methyl ester carboxylesterase
MTATQSGTFDGVYIEHASAAQPTAAPIVFVHGGMHGSWVWDKWLPYFAVTGRHCYSFSWFGRNGSRELPDPAFAARTQADTVEELETVVAHVGQTPIMIAHSMGATVVQKYAEKHPTLAQVLLAPSICAEVGVIDAQFHYALDAPVEPPPFDLAWQLFLGGCPEEDARRYHALLTRESPTAMKQAILAETSVDRTRISGPSLMVAAEHDVVVPAEAVRRSATHFGSDYLFLADRSHNMVLEPRWQDTADRILAWLNHNFW